MFIFANQSPTLQKNIKLSYLKAFFIQKAALCIEIGKPNLFKQDLFSKQKIDGFIK